MANLISLPVIFQDGKNPGKYKGSINISCTTQITHAILLDEKQVWSCEVFENNIQIHEFSENITPNNLTSLIHTPGYIILQKNS